MSKTKVTTLSERFLQYRKNASKKTKTVGLASPKKEVKFPEIIYPNEYDIREELSNLTGFKK